MARNSLTKALEENRAKKLEIYWDHGGIRGPEPAVSLPPEKVIFDSKHGRVFITLQDLIGVVKEVLRE